MSQSFVDQITLDFLLNKEMMGKHVMKQREKQIDKQDFQFYKKRILHLFEELISNDYTEDLSPDVKYAYDTFIKTTINYFKIVDNNDLLQEEYKDLDFLPEFPPELSDNENGNGNGNGNDSKNLDISGNFMEADKLMMRSVKMDLPLDKYVKQSSNKTRDNNVILPKQREVDIMNPELKNKGIKDIEEKKNITIIYEDIQKPKKYKNV
jgi:hypothetical protein